MMRTRWVGNSLFGFDWASDFKWDWTSNRGDRHSDYASIAVCRGRSTEAASKYGSIRLMDRFT